MPHDSPPPRALQARGDGACVEFERNGTLYTVLSYPVPRNPILLELTSAELAILDFWLDGASAEEIATRRGSAVRTVNNQVAAIYRKLGCRSRAELATLVRSVPHAPPPLQKKSSPLRREENRRVDGPAADERSA